MHEERARPERRAHHRFREILIEHCVRQLRQNFADDSDSLIELGVDVLARTRALSELQLAITHVAGAAEDCADEMLEVARDVQCEIARGVGDTGQGRPHALIVRKQGELALEAFELADQSQGKINGRTAHCRS